MGDLTQSDISELVKITFFQKEIPELGKMTFCSHVTAGMMIDACRITEKADKNQQSDIFTNFLLSKLITEPSKDAQDVANFSEATLDAVVQVCIDIAGIREEFELTASDSSVRSRFHSAYMRVQEEYHDELAKCFYRNLDEFNLSPMINQINEALQKMKALNLRISIPELPDIVFRNDAMFQGIAEAIRRAYSEPLRDLVNEIAQMRLPEPLLAEVLQISGLESAIFNPPTYVLSDLTVLDETYTHRRHVEAYEVLILVEQSLRDVIESRLGELHGEDWWKRCVPEDVRRDCEWRKLEREKPSDVVLHPIYYANVYDYGKIITRNDNWRDVFSLVFGNKKEFEVCIQWVGDGRNPIAHTRPISDESYRMFITAALRIRSHIERQTRSRD